MIDTKNSLLKAFIENAEATSARTHITPRNSAVIAEKILELTSNSEKLLMAKPLSLDPSLFKDLFESSKIISDPSENSFVQGVVGLTDAFAGVASTGSVCVTLTDKTVNLISMLASKHIVVLDSNHIFALPRDILSDKSLSKDHLTSSFSFITGPSATADMGPLVRGVHGPGELDIIIVE